MIKKSEIFRMILMVLLISLLVLPGVYPGGGRAAASAPGSESVNPPTDSQSYTIFIPLLANFSPVTCGTIPFLIVPADGSQVNSETLLVLDGGYRGGDLDWLGYEFSRAADFASKRGGYLQPAGKYWQLRLGNYHLEPGKWYWRATVWCHGPGWPPPPDGYDQSPYSQVWSFVVGD